MNAFTLFLYENRPEWAIAYRLYCRELDVTLPWPGNSRRDGTRPQSKDFRLEPVEFPLLPLRTSYEVIWVNAGGGALPSYPPDNVSPGWVDDMRNMGEVGRLLRLFLARRKEDATAAAQQMILDHGSERAASFHQLPPHEQGNPDDDPGST